jgi:hypothetical protein
MLAGSGWDARCDLDGWMPFAPQLAALFDRLHRTDVRRLAVMRSTPLLTWAHDQSCTDPPATPNSAQVGQGNPLKVIVPSASDSSPARRSMRTRSRSTAPISRMISTPFSTSPWNDIS